MSKLKEENEKMVSQIEKITIEKDELRQKVLILLFSQRLLNKFQMKQFKGKKMKMKN